MGSADTTEAMLRKLMLSSLDGDGSAYRVLLSELARYLKRYYTRRLHPAHGAGADDLVQETLMAIHDRRMTYDRGRPFTPWVKAIAHYKFVDHARRGSRQATVPLSDDMPIFASDENAALDVSSALSSIPARSSQLIRRVKLEGASIAEAAREEGMSESAARVAIHRALKLLRARFAGKDDE